ncbi:MAG: hypothetical protein ABII26_08990 [Pseudomonadota bacterium]
MGDHDIPPCLIYIDKEGRWFHKGVEMIHREFIRLFYQHMEMDSMGRYIIHLRGERCYLEVEDTPFVVRRVEIEDSDPAVPSRFLLFLSDDSREELSPDTLHIGKGNVLYCKVKGPNFPARFSRPAYYQLAAHVEEEDERFFLPLNGERYFIQEI